MVENFGDDFFRVGGAEKGGDIGIGGGSFEGGESEELLVASVGDVFAYVVVAGEALDVWMGEDFSELGVFSKLRPGVGILHDKKVLGEAGGFGGG